MTTEEVKAKAAERLAAENEAFLRGEEVAADRVLNDAREGDFEVTLEMQGHDPRQVSQPEPQKPSEPKEWTVQSLLETWYVWQTCGRLKTVGLIPSGDDGAGVEEQMLVSLYVESTPGYSRAILLHGEHHRGEPDPFRGWYGRWPDNRQLAQAIYDGFGEALRQRLRVEPFVIYAVNKAAPDHLEQAELANDADLSLRNREWRRRAA